MNKITLSSIHLLNESDIDSLSNQLRLLNKNLTDLIAAIGSQSFWDSQLFAAILGASSAIIVLIVQRLWNWHNLRKDKMDKIYKCIGEQNVFWSPRSLFKKASNTHYAGTEITIGKKMVIDLRSSVKYWRYPNYFIRKLFKKYEHSLMNFNNCKDNNYEKYFVESESLLEKIKEIAFKKTGENQWTIR